MTSKLDWDPSTLDHTLDPHDLQISSAPFCALGIAEDLFDETGEYNAYQADAVPAVRDLLPLLHDLYNEMERNPTDISSFYLSVDHSGDENSEDSCYPTEDDDSLSSQSTNVFAAANT